MLEGYEVSIPTCAGDSALIAAARAILLHWPDAVFEECSGGALFDRFEAVPFGRLDELFVYRDAAAAKLWDEEGAVPEALHKMIHVVSDPGFLTLAVDDPDEPATRSIVATVKSYVQESPSFLLAAEPEPCDV